MKRTIEIEDSLEDCENDVKTEILDDFIEWLEENPDEEDFDTYYQASGADTVAESSDSNTPIYNSEIDGVYYLYGDELEEAYNNAGIGKGGEDNHRQVAICMYLEAKGFDYLRELEEAFKEWRLEYNELPAANNEEFSQEQKDSLKANKRGVRWK